MTPQVKQRPDLQVVHAGTRPLARVAIVIPVHNNREFVDRTLQSVLEQSVTDWECVVIDDGSTDGTSDRVQPYLVDDRFRLLQQDNAGSPAARNAGLSQVTAGVPYVAFLDGDDIWLPDALEVLLTRLEEAPDAVGVYGTAEYLDAAGNPIRVGEHPARQRDRRLVRGLDLVSVPPDVPETTFSMLLVSGPIWPAAVAVHRRDVIELVGRFDEELRLQQDWDLYLRAARLGRYLFLDRQVAWYRQHDTNVTSRTLDRVYFQDKVRHKAWSSEANTARQRREIARAWRALQHRRVLTASKLALRELRSGQRRGAAQAARSTVALGAQLLSAGPPAPNREHVALTRREI